MDRTIDYRALTEPISDEDVAAYRRSGRGAGLEHTILVVLIALIVGGIALVTVVVPFAFGVMDVLGGGEAGVLAPPAIMAAVLALAAFGIWRLARLQLRQRARMSRWASDNGLVYEAQSPEPQYPGLIFGRGSQRRSTDHFRTAEGRYLDFGNYSYTTGSGKNRTTHRYGYLALHLDRALPHMLLDSRANNGLFGASNLPAAFDRTQVLSLEGDFDRYFTLYCPIQYERDALYVFTPDLMALAIDEAAPFDIEIVDRWLFVYSSTPFPLADARTYGRLLRIVDTVGAKALSQTDRYRDERIGDPAVNLVAPAGARLRPGVNVVGLVAVIAVAVIGVAMVVGFPSG